MTRVVGLRWRKADPVRYAEAGDLSLPLNCYVVLQLEKSQELAWVCREAAEMVARQPEEDLNIRIVRKATSGDLGRLQQNRDSEQDTFKIARAKARELQIPMKIVDAHYTFDRSRMVVTFGAEGRVDFRPLIHALSSAVGARVELRQVGDRDVAKLTGGIGRCGNELCCVRWITKFESISVRMAKEQALPISAEGLAGACGRLRCCLRFEYEQYRQVNRALPKIGELVGTPNGSATVIVGHRIKETVSVRYQDDRVMELALADVTRNQDSGDQSAP
ncbi:MAG: regulatory iron-sulfur-containing complex subunit RicT [Chloroflexi bacterium]|nr:regulatory iron-sulfur-containing complex subunit RicT [Chloroflexota bacterium]MDA1271250.1 regulatory iron-sulfur-containing complex subunit RicT [Chloroflexota bacterium]